MSKVTDVQAALNSLIASVLPSYDLLPDSIDPSDNTLLRLEKGYSTSYGNGQNTSENICNNSMRVSRTFPIILTNAYVANFSPTYRLDMERALMEDHYKMISAIEKSITLNGVAVSVRYDGDSGIEYLEGDTKRFIALVSQISIEYIERF